MFPPGSSFQKDREILEKFVKSKMSKSPILISIHPLTLASRDLFLLAKVSDNQMWYPGSKDWEL